MCCRVCLGLLTLECFVEVTSVLSSLSGAVNSRVFCGEVTSVLSSLSGAVDSRVFCGEVTSVLPSLSGGVLSVPSVFCPCFVLTARSWQVQVVEGLFREQGHQVQTSVAVSTTLVRCSVIIKK